jgi:hypothetical protein
LQIEDVGPQGSHQECGHVRGDAAGKVESDRVYSDDTPHLQDAVDCATQALEKYNIEKDIAAYIKKEFDKKYVRKKDCLIL